MSDTSSEPRQRRSFSSMFSKGVGLLVGGAFILFWSGLTLLADGAMLASAAWQIWSYTYAATDGIILKNEVVTDSSGEDTTYDLDLSYEYRVAGQKFTGTKYRHSTMKTQGNWCRAIVERFPADSRRTVYYDPEQPERAVLLRGIEGLDLYIVLFLTPFNLVMLTGWVMMYRAIVPASRHEDTGGVPVRDDGVELRAFVPDHGAMLVTALTLGGMSFAAIFLVGCLTGMRPNLPVMAGVWAVLLSVTVWFGGRRYLRNWLGLSDLIIDRFGQRLTLPVTFGRKAPLTLGFADVKKITIKEERTVDSEGAASYTYAVIVKQHRVSGEERILLQSERERAELFLTWLRKTMGIAPDVQPAKKKNRRK
ncbi:MAG: DUF3592 domain-containing protein [Planctomycetia bacterium]|nr:DUF3592 domain-containing protein [Planctomycetia bacterium]